MLLATAVGVIGLPLLAPLAVVADLVRGRSRLPTLRVYLFLVQYGINDSVEILLAPIYWVMTGFGARIAGPASIARHERLQWWSARLLERRAEQLLGLRVELDEADRSALTPGPVIVIGRHVSLFDASLPGLIYRREDYRVRAVIMAELLADPGFDLIYSQTGSVFIPRDRGPEALSAIQAMTSTVAADEAASTAVIIFPEGRLFRRSVRDRLLAGLADSDPDRADRLAGLDRLLPPRPGGLLALLEAMPEADVVLLDHRGLDPLRGVADLLAAVPAKQPVTVTARRVPRSEIPTGRDKQIEWLDGLWLDLDTDLGRDLSAADPTR